MRRRFFLMENPGAGIAGSPLVEDVVRQLARGGASVTRERRARYTRRPPRNARKAARERQLRRRHRGRRRRHHPARGRRPDRHGRCRSASSPSAPATCWPTRSGCAHAGRHRAHAARRARRQGRLRAGQRRAVPADGRRRLRCARGGALDQRLKSRLGKAAYAGPLLGRLIRPVDTLMVTVDGRRHTASWAVIANARHYGGRFVLAPRTGILQRGLQAILFKTTQPRRPVRTAHEPGGGPPRAARRARRRRRDARHARA